MKYANYIMGKVYIQHFRTCWYLSEISLVHCTHVRFLVHHQFRRKCLMHAFPRGNLYIMFISPWKVSEPLSMLFVMASTYFFYYWHMLHLMDPQN